MPPARRALLTTLVLAPFAQAWAGSSGARRLGFPRSSYSKFSKHLKPVGRALELPDYHVWCNSPICGPDGFCVHSQGCLARIVA